MACLAMNAMSAHNGASPFQLVCGSNPRLAAVLTDGLPLLCDGAVAGDEALHLIVELLHGARTAPTQAEADTSLRRALARNKINVPHRTWAVGDTMYYRNRGALAQPRRVARPFPRHRRGRRQEIRPHPSWPRLDDPACVPAPPGRRLRLKADRQARLPIRPAPF